MTDVPKEWEEVRLGDLASIIRGVTYKKHEALLHPAEGHVPLIRATNIGRSLDFDGLYFVPAARVSDDQRLRRGDVVVASSSGSASVVGKSAQLKSDWSGTFGGFCAALRPGRQLSASYIGLFLQSDDVRRRWSDLARGSNINNLRVEHLADTPVPFPPLAEQERIVVAIEEAFSKLDAGEAGLRTVRRLLKRMRDAVLAAAVTGLLVPQDPTDTPAAKLLADLGVEPIEPERDVSTLPGSWAVARVGELLAGPLANGRSVRTRAGGFPVLRLTCLRDGRIDLGETKEGEWDIADAARYLVQRGDFLVSRGNGSLDLVGRGGLVDVDPEPVAYPDTLIRLRVSESVLGPSFLAMLWNSAVVRRQLEAQARTTAGIYKVNQSMIAEVRLPIAPRDEQVRIVTEVDRQFSFLDACERAVDAAIARGAATRRSVLKAAFDGKLVPQDPSDEPASVLLDRIRAERAAAPKPFRRTRTTA